jgi:hypothetical protein
VNTIDEYKAIRTEYNRRIRDRLQRIAKKLAVGVVQVLAFEECAQTCDLSHDMAGETNEQMHASYSEPHGPWSSCFAGCNLGIRHDKDGKTNNECQAACYGNSVEPYFCQMSCTKWSNILENRVNPQKERVSRLDFQGSKSENEGDDIEGDWANDSEEDWDEEVDTMMGRRQQKVQYAEDEADHLQQQLQECTNLSSRDPEVPMVKARALADGGVAPPLWAEGLTFHHQIRVNTLAEYAHTRTMYKRLITDRVQAFANKFYVPMYQVLAFEQCSEWCDTWKWCKSPPCDVENEADAALISAYPEPHGSWSSCFSGCNMGFQHDPNGTNVGACQRACEGQAIETYFCAAVGCEHWQTSISELTPTRRRVGASRKRLASESGGSLAVQPDVDIVDEELCASQKRIQRLRAKLEECKTGSPA